MSYDPYFFMFLVLLETAHVVSPFVLCGTNKNLRRLVAAEWKTYLAPSIGVFAVFMVCGVTALPVATLVQIYLVANFWHFSMQNFGVLQLAYAKTRRINFVVAFCATAVGMVYVPLTVQVHHWVTDIGLSHRASGARWAYLLAVMLLAPIAIFWNATPWQTFHWQPPHVLIDAVKFLVVFRYALSFAHFTISARIWRFSDPLMRATIGKELVA